MNNTKAVDQLIPDTPYSELNFNTTVEVDELNQLRKRLQQNIGFLNVNRERVRHQEFTQLMNYHQFALNTLNNMVNIKEVEHNNPYNQNIRRYGLKQKLTPFQPSSDQPNMAIYDDRGAIKTLNSNQLRHREEWEMQFDQNVINPPCYMMPPSNCFDPRTKSNR
jgi:hypothetical protein